VVRYLHCTACLYGTLYGTHNDNFTFTLLVITCDILQHVVGHVGPSVVGFRNLRLSGESYTTVATLHFVILNKSPTRCNSMQSDLFHCKVTLHVSGVTAAIIENAKNCNRSLR